MILVLRAQRCEFFASFIQTQLHRILQGATHEQWNEISTMLHKRQYAAFIVYKKGKPVDVRWVDQYKPATKRRIQEDADAKVAV